ncbi:hypothetical protein [Planctobacterium marinum]|uniref:hypothetical protein n=1 Tax=Planctobacterium marinum TaxID=1631968 RepID=UPI001E51E7EA|nr:hypothetical protein [Planctobacterium marinum]MCC2607495.1 hypothetical protein [Planctobacterium marinum]
MITSHAIRLIWVLVTGIGTSFSVFSDDAAPQGLNARLDFSTRADFRSDKVPRYQYRVRFYPQLSFNENWSVNAFAVTGDEFSSSYNTFGADENHRFYLRRFYLRHQSQYGKTELGSIPTYKGRVSSTGLSKDGWIAGIRHVRDVSAHNKVEIVVGELAHTQSPDAFHAINRIDYLEFELSARITDKLSYELGLERMLNENFLRAELRYQVAGEHIVAMELVDRTDNNHLKAVMILEGPMPIPNYQMDYFLYYSYVDASFGARAELTEDFVDFGHALTFELEGELIAQWGWDWFSKLELNEGQKRLQLGLKFKI